jgi:hypothetical protein
MSLEDKDEMPLVEAYKVLKKDGVEEARKYVEEQLKKGSEKD